MNILKQPLLLLIGIALLTIISCKKTEIGLATQNELKISEATATSAGMEKSVLLVSGQGGLTLNGRVQHFAFQASIDVNGVVSGSWESKSPGQDSRTHGTIDCLVFPDNKTAILSGTITQLDGYAFGYQVGDPVWFMVRDNGEGVNDPPDEFSDYYLGRGGCFDYGSPLRNIEDGNIQITANAQAASAAYTFNVHDNFDLNGFSTYDECTGESVSLSGTEAIVTHGVYNGKIYLFDLNVNSQGIKGVGETTGNNYVVTEKVKIGDSYNFNNNKLSFTIFQTFKINTAGSANNFYYTRSLKYIIDFSAGTFTVTRDTFEIGCR